LPNTYLEGAITLKFDDQATNSLNNALQAAAGNITAVNTALNGISWNNLNPQGLSSDLTSIADSYNKIANALRRFQQLQSKNINQIQLPQIDISSFTTTSQRIQDYTNLVNSAMNLANINKRRLARNIKLPDITLPDLTPDKVTNLQKYVDLINHLTMSFQMLTSVAPTANKQLAQIGNGMKSIGTQKPGKEWNNWFVNMALWLPKQVAMAAIWSGIYRTIGLVNQEIREGLQMYSQLQVGLGRALSTGMNKGQVQNAFTPEAQGGYEESRQKLKSLAGLQALLFTSQHKANVEEYTGALYELTSANIGLEDAMKMVETSMKVSIAAGGNIEQVTRSLAGIYNVFKDRITDVSGAQAKFAQIGNTVLYVWAKEQMELSELNNALKYSANIASMMNIDYRVLVATIGHLNTQMLRGSTAGTGLRQMWNASAKNMDQLVDLFGEANQGLKDFAANNNRAYDPSKPVDFIAILGDLRAQLMQGKKETDGMVFSANDLKKAFKTFDLRGGNILLTLLNSYDSLKGKIADVMNLNENFIDQYVRLRELDPTTQLNILMKNFQAIPTAFLMGIEGKDTLAKSLEEVNKNMSVVLASAFKLGEGFQVMWKKIAENKDMLITIGDTMISFMAEIARWGELLYPTAEILSKIVYHGYQLVRIPLIVVTSAIGDIVKIVNVLYDAFDSNHKVFTKFIKSFDFLDAVKTKWSDFKKEIAEIVYILKGGDGSYGKNLKDAWSKLWGGKGDKGKDKKSLQDLIAGLGKDIDTNKFLEQNTYAETFKKLEKDMQGVNNEIKQLDMGSKKFVEDLQAMIKEAADLNSHFTAINDIQGAINTSTVKYENIYDAIANSYSAKQIKNISEQLTLARQLTLAYKEVYDQQVKDYTYRESTLKQQGSPEGMRGTIEKDIQDRKDAYGKGVSQKEIDSYSNLIKKYEDLIKAQANLKTQLENGSISQKAYNLLTKISLETIHDLLQQMNKAPENVKGFYKALNDEKGLKEYDAKLKRIEEIKKRMDALRAEEDKYKKNPMFFVESMGLNNYNKHLSNIYNEYMGLSTELNTLEKQVNEDSQKMTQALSDSVNESIKANENSIEKLRQKLPGLIQQMRDAYKTAQESLFTELDYPGMTPEEKQEAKLKNQQRVRTDKIDNLMKDNKVNQGNIQGQIDSLEMVRTGAAERKAFLSAQLEEEKGLYSKYNEWKINAEQENNKELLQLHIKQAQDKANLDFQINKATMTKQQQALFQIEHQYDGLLVHYAGNKQMEAKINRAIEGEKKDTILKMTEELNQQLQKLADDRLKIAQDLAEKELSLERKTNETKIFEAGAANIKRLAAGGASDETIQKAMDKFSASMEGVGKQWDQKEAQGIMKQAKQEEANLNKHKTDLENSLKNMDARIANAQKTGNKSLVEELKKERAGIVNEIERTRVDIINAKIKYIDAKKQLAQSQLDLATMHVGEKDFSLRSAKKGIEQGNYPSDIGLQIGGDDNIGVYLQGPTAPVTDQMFGGGRSNNRAIMQSLEISPYSPAITGGNKMTTPIIPSGTTTPANFNSNSSNQQEANGLQALNNLQNNVLLHNEVKEKQLLNMRQNRINKIYEEIVAEEKLYQKNKQTWGASLEKRNEARPGSIINSMGRSIANIFAPNKMPGKSLYDDEQIKNLDKIRDIKQNGGKVADTISIVINDKKISKSMPAEVETHLSALANSIQRNKTAMMGVA